MILSSVNGFKRLWQMENKLVLTFLYLVGITSTALGQDSANFTFECETYLCEETSFSDGKPILNYEEDNFVFQKGAVLVYEIIDQVSGLANSESKFDTGSVTITVDPQVSKLMREMVGSYHQTGVRYSYSPNLKISTAETGVIENVRNIWIHPFRGGQLAKVNLNAYPFVKFPLRLGEDYEWELSVGGSKYSDPRWKTWSGATVRKHLYKVVRKEKVLTPLGKEAIDVFVIQAETQGDIGHTSAEFWYNEYFGFIRIAYCNIDGTKTVFRLLKV